LKRKLLNRAHNSIRIKKPVKIPVRNHRDLMYPLLFPDTNDIVLLGPGVNVVIITNVITGIKPDKMPPLLNFHYSQY